MIDCAHYCPDFDYGMVKPGDPMMAFCLCERERDLTEEHRLRWVACEACAGSGEIIRSDPGVHQCDTYNEICAACEGTGRDCVDTHPVGCEDTQSTAC